MCNDPPVLSKSLSDCGEEFLQQVVADGYSPQTVRQYERTLARFCEEVLRSRLDLASADASLIDEIQQRLLARLTGSTVRSTRYRLNRLVEHFQTAGIIATPIKVEKPKSPREQLRDEYEAYLCVQRGLSPSTVYHCVRYFERFMTYRFGESLGDLQQLTAHDVVNFLTQLHSGSKPRRDKTPPSHLRNLFQFLFWSGKTSKNLAKSVPRVRQPQPTNQPRYLSPDKVQRLLDAVRTDDVLGRRNYAMLLLMARLGLRATEVIAIQLDDIYWRAGELLVRGKGQLHDRMPLLPDVGESLVDYLQNARKGTSRILFLRHRAPHHPFVDSQVLNMVLRQAFQRTGLTPPHKYVGSHVLRHSLATDLLRNGSSLNEIGDVLRHRSRATTALYAKHDIAGLRSIAREWPVAGEAS